MHWRNSPVARGDRPAQESDPDFHSAPVTVVEAVKPPASEPVVEAVKPPALDSFLRKAQIFTKHNASRSRAELNRFHYGLHFAKGTLTGSTTSTPREPVVEAVKPPALDSFLRKAQIFTKHNASRSRAEPEQVPLRVPFRQGNLNRFHYVDPEGACSGGC